MLTSIIIALSLNFDTFSVSVIEGANLNKLRIFHLLKTGLFFGIGQASMAVIGVLLGSGFKNIISSFDHWIAFILLLFIGSKMIWDSKINKLEHNNKGISNTGSLFLLVIATSIDSLVVGISYAFISSHIIFDILIIGLVSFIASLSGLYFGKKLKSVSGNMIKVAGGFMLILIGLKILIEHITSV